MNIVERGKAVRQAREQTVFDANRNDSQEALALVDAIPPLQGARGRLRSPAGLRARRSRYDAAASITLTTLENPNSVISNVDPAIS